MRFTMTETQTVEMIKELEELKTQLTSYRFTMTETQTVEMIKELEELKTQLTSYGSRLDVNSDIIRFYLSTKQRNILLMLVISEMTDLAYPTLIERLQTWWKTRKENRRGKRNI